MVNINLKQLEAFVTVADCGSFTEAAEQLYVAQSTVSGHIRALEEELGTTLILRSGKRKLSLTESGRGVYVHACEILQHCKALSRESEYGDMLRIGASTIPGQYIAPGYIAAFCQQYPECRVSLQKGDSESVHNMVLGGEVQLGFVGSVMDRKELVYQQVGEDRLVLITPNTPYYRDRQKAGVPGCELLEEPMIFRESGSGTQRAVDEYLTRIGIGPEQVKKVAATDSSEVMLQLVSRGMGNAVVSSLSAQQWAREGAVLLFELGRGEVSRQIYMIHRRHGYPGTWARKFLEYMQSK